MLLDKPPWVSHDKSGRDLFSVDVSPDAARFATGGADNKVKIWALPAVLRAEAEAASSAPGGTPLLLATLPEHCGPVNALRFSRSGRRLASGSDDKLVLVHELRAGAPRPVFGSADPPAVENWAVRLACAAAWRVGLTASPATVRAATSGPR
jgi:protein HIRA/HIR1